MGVHASGDGAAWDSLENLDVDQPHGLDYRESVHMAKAVRLRLDQEHTTFGDSTAGGIHMPGGVAVLGMELTDDGGDITAVVVGDGTYRARGLVWAWDGSADARLWCSTKAAGNSTTGDWTLLALHPDKQWGGRDVTWAGDHEFGGDVDITGDVSVGGALYVDASADFSGAVNITGTFEVTGNVGITGDLTMSGTLKVATDVSITGDMGIDGTSNFFDEVDFSDVYLRGDVTGSALGIVAIFGARTFTDTVAGALVHTSIYKAQCDGFLTVTSATDGNAFTIFAEQTDTSPDVVVAYTESNSNITNGVTVPIRKDDYVQVAQTEGAAAAIMSFVPIGTGGLVKQ